MPVVAVAGGTGHLGRAIVDALIADGKNEVLVLARESTPTKEKEIGARILAIDYTNPTTLAALLEANNITTLISTTNSKTSAVPEQTLFHAASQSATTTRYIPSIWGIEPTSQIAAHFPAGVGQAKLDLIKAIDSPSTTLETTMILNGFFLDYFVAPKVPSYFQPLAFAIDFAHDTAAIPGSGDVPAVFTHTWDIARFVAALVASDEKWERKSYIIGDKVTWKEFVRFAEGAKERRFEVGYDSLEMLRRGEVTELPSHREAYPFFPKEVLQGLLAGFGVMIEEGVFDFEVPEGTLNGRFPGIRARGVKRCVFEAWER